MYRPRLIPVVLINNEGDAIKTLKFKKRFYLGDPVNTVSLFNSFKVDELVLLNIDSHKNLFEINHQLLSNISQEAEMPFAIGGGIKTLNDIRTILKLGAEKVIISSEFLKNPTFLKEAVDHFGSSSIVVCIDVKKNLFGKYKVHTRSVNNISNDLVDVLDFILEYEAGEMIIQSIDKDGTFGGYDEELCKYVSDYMQIPTIVLGGMGSIDEVHNLIKKSHISGYAAGSKFVFQDEERGVLINYPSLEELAILYN